MKNEFNIIAQNRLALAVLEIVNVYTFSPDHQGTKQLSGRVEDVSYDVTFSHVLGNTYIQGEIGHMKVVMQGRSNQGYCVWLLDNFGELGVNGPQGEPFTTANPHSNKAIEDMFETAFARVDDHATRLAVVRKGEHKGVAVMREAALVGVTKILAYLAASGRTSNTNWNTLGGMNWDPEKEHLLKDKVIEINRASGAVLIIRRTNTGSVEIKVYKNKDTLIPVFERRITMHPFDQLTGEHSSLRQYIREAIDHILEMEKQ